MSYCADMLWAYGKLLGNELLSFLIQPRTDLAKN